MTEKPASTSSLARASGELVPADLSDLDEDEVGKAIQAFVRNAVASSTREVYARAMRTFERWCQEQGQPQVPADPRTVAGFLSMAAQDGKSQASLGVILGAIRAAHLSQGLPSPTDHPLVRLVMRGAARANAGRRPDRRKQPLRGDDELHRMIMKIEGEIDGSDMLDGRTLRGAELREQRALERINLAGHRDRAVLLLGFAGALRRSEIAALDLKDLRWAPQGLILTVPRSKADQEGKGREIGIVPGERHCPIAALKTWLSEARIDGGPLFRRISRGANVSEKRLNGASIARLVKDRAKAAGLDPDDFSGHSLRSGFLTSAASSGASIWKMMDQAGQKTVDVTRRYVRDRELFESNAGKGLL